MLYYHVGKKDDLSLAVLEAAMRRSAPRSAGSISNILATPEGDRR